MTKFLGVLSVVVALGAAQAGCGAIKDKPRTTVNSQIESVIEEAGSHPSAWVFDNDCLVSAGCSASAAPTAAPNSIVAYNRYLVKDSRATMRGRDLIKAAVEKAVRKQCFARRASREALVRCIVR